MASKTGKDKDGGEHLVEAGPMPGKPNRRKTHALLADVPVDRPQDDQLGRLPFAQTLAKTITSMKGHDSFVFGLCGPWGSGKSSILRLVQRQLESSRSRTKPLVCEFNPWWFSGHDQLLRSFLDQLGAVVGRSDNGKRVSDLGEKLSVFGKILRPLSWIPGAGVVKEVAEAVEAGAEASKRIGEYLSQDVAGLRKEIDDILKRSEQRIVVLMDDIDRLAAQEIAQLFLIVKAVADFSNTAYVLAFDHGVVSNAITSTLGLDGAAYLEKIVQVQIDIPPCGPVQLQELFLAQLGELLDDESVTDKTRQDFGNLFHDGLKDFFLTPRSVKRLTNVLRVLLPSVRGEVYWPDFVAITTLMVFVPAAYRSIRDSAAEFTGLDDRRHWNRDEARKFYQTWLAQIPELHRQAVGQIIQRLFPRVEVALTNQGYGPSFQSQWRSDLRVCSRECFDRYFQLRVPEGEFSEADWREVVPLLNEPDRLDRFIAECCETSRSHDMSSRARAFLERATLFARHQATVDQARALFRTIVRNGDLIISVKDSDCSHVIPIDNKTRLRWLMQRCLARVTDPEERDQLVEVSLKSEAGLRTAVEFLWFFGAEHGKYGQNRNDQFEPPLLSLACVDRLEAAVLDRIRTAATDGTLEKDPEFNQVAYHWEWVTGIDEVKNWIQRVASTDRGFVRVADQLKGFGTVHGMRDRVATRVPTFSSKTLVRWLDATESRKRAETLLAERPDWLLPHQVETLRLLVRSIDTDGSPVDLMLISRGRETPPVQGQKPEVRSEEREEVGDAEDSKEM